MIKGVNKRVVEITSTDSDYFERAVLYVRADKLDLPSARLEEEAREYIGRIAPRRGFGCKSDPVSLILKLSLAAAAVLAVTLVVYLIIFL
ncbi:MAG: hypothetical protein NC085_13250 [Muribaculaceae bacterium]|nr:hypothetical protein [Muribaculaceae bacterium]